jgi:hypothetical protein
MTIIAGSVKDNVLQAVHKLGRSASRTMIFRTRISTDDTVDIALKALVRDRLLTLNPADIYELTDAGCSELGIAPGEPPKATAPSITRPTQKRCGKCGETKAVEQFQPDGRGRDGRKPDCVDCNQGARRRVVQTESVGTVVGNVQQPEMEPRLTSDIAVLSIATELGVYVRIEADRVYINQPIGKDDPPPIHLTRKRGLELGQFLCRHLGGDP